MEGLLPKKIKTSSMLLMGLGLVAAGIVIYYLFYKQTTAPKQLQQTQQLQQAQQPQQQQQLRPALVLFWSKDCGHSINMKGEWDSAAEILNSEGVVDAIDFESSANGDVIKEAMRKLPNFRGYPDIRFFPEGYDLNRKSSQFQGNRTQQDFIGFAYGQAK